MKKPATMAYDMSRLLQSGAVFVVRQRTLHGSNCVFYFYLNNNGMTRVELLILSCDVVEGDTFSYKDLRFGLEHNIYLNREIFI